MGMTRSAIRWFTLIGGSACAIALGACAAGANDGPITHVVLVTLDDPAGRVALERDTRAMLARVPGIVEFTVGTPIGTGRAAVDGSYDVGFSATFKSAGAYADYEHDPAHVALKDAWRARVKELRMFDFGHAGTAVTPGP